MSKRQAFSPATIAALAAGKINDPATVGLSIVATGKGARLKRTWRYQRRVSGTATIHNASGGTFPAVSIGDARIWAESLNTACEAGIDPAARSKVVTLDAAHALYMEAVEEGKHKVRRTVAGRPIRETTKRDKLRLYTQNVSPVLGNKPIEEVTEAEIDAIILAMSEGTGRRKAPTQANRCGAEMRVFFAWAMSRRGKSVLGVEVTASPAARVGELWNPQAAKERWLDHEELPLFLRALALQPGIHHRRGLALLLLTGCRKSELFEAPTSEYLDGIWAIPGERTKNGQDHTIEMGAWGRVLMASDGPYIITSPKPSNAVNGCETVPMTCGWPKILERIRRDMERLGGRTVEHFTLHDLRRTMRSHVEDHDIDDVVAEKMINHALGGLKKIYNRNKRAAALSAAFAKWDKALADMARKAGVANQLGVANTVYTV